MYIHTCMHTTVALGWQNVAAGNFVTLIGGSSGEGTCMRIWICTYTYVLQTDHGSSGDGTCMHICICMYACVHMYVCTGRSVGSSGGDGTCMHCITSTQAYIALHCIALHCIHTYIHCIALHPHKHTLLQLRCITSMHSIALGLKG
jgi:hypothetical protein